MSDVTIRLRAGTFRINGKPWMDLHNEAADRIEELQAEVARLKESLEAIIWEYDPYDAGGIAERMFDIAFDAKTHGEADQ
tara:strand:+ start:575 stop:814 length:240 start_codon:yes stop_codon:yes gene_type:complete